MNGLREQSHDVPPKRSEGVYKLATGLVCAVSKFNSRDPNRGVSEGRCGMLHGTTVLIFPVEDVAVMMRGSVGLDLYPEVL